METLLHAALSNAALVAVLAPIVSLFGRVTRRPALVHSLWLLILLKLITPPLWPVSLAWPVPSEADPLTREWVASESESSAELADTVSPGGRMEEKSNDVSEELAAQAAPNAGLVSSMPRSLGAPATAKPVTAPQTSHSATTATSFHFSWQSFLASIWLLGSLGWLALAGYRVHRFRRLLRFTERAPENLQGRTRRLAERLGLGRCPGVWVVAAPVSPLLWALVGEPRLLVPASLLDRLTEEQWDTLLAHELAHLRRGDHWVRRLELAILSLYWWHPVVWWARRELREVEEQCCDAWVVWALPGAAEVYAATLIQTVTYLSGARSVLPLAASGIGQKHFLKRRLTMIMRGTTPRALSAAGFFAVLGLAAVLLPLHPTWAQTEPRTDVPYEHRPSSGTATTTGRFVGAPHGAALGINAEAPDQVGSGVPTGVIEAGSVTVGRSIGDGRGSTETVEDAQDEVDLLRVQLDVRRAEQREVEARLRQARTGVDISQQLASNNQVSRGELERARTEVEVQEARLAGKNAQVKEAELRLKQAECRLARLRRTPTPVETAAPSQDRPMGSAMPPPLPNVGAISGPGMRPGAGRGMRPGMPGAAMAPPGSTAASGGMPGGPSSGFSFGSGGTSFGGGGSFGGSTSSQGAMAGSSSGGGYGGRMGPGVGTASSLEHRLAEVEKKLQNLIEEMKALRKEQRPEHPRPATP